MEGSPSRQLTEDGAHVISGDVKPVKEHEPDSSATSAYDSALSQTSKPSALATEPNATSSTIAAGSSSLRDKNAEKGSLKALEVEKETDLEAQTRSSASSKNEEVHAEAPDPSLVDFDGPDDPTNARNWSSRKKWGNIAVIASITFLTYSNPPSTTSNDANTMQGPSHPPCSLPAFRK